MKSANLRSHLFKLSRRIVGSDLAVIVLIERDGTATTLTMPGGGGEKDLREIERNILEAATHQPQNTKQLAAKAGYQPNSYFRGTLAALRDRGALVKVTEGWRLP